MMHRPTLELSERLHPIEKPRLQPCKPGRLRKNPRPFCAQPNRRHNDVLVTHAATVRDLRTKKVYTFKFDALEGLNFNELSVRAMSIFAKYLKNNDVSTVDFHDSTSAKYSKVTDFFSLTTIDGRAVNDSHAFC